MFKISDLDTPALMLREDILLENIKDMSSFAKEVGVKLRPHIKAHKIPAIANMQLEMGAKGITVSKLGEAEVMIDAGIKDILIAYQLIGKNKMEKLMNLAKKAKITVAVDSLEGIKYLNQASQKYRQRIDVVIEINSGLDRCGVLPGLATLKLANHIKKLENLILKGIMTHAGHVYGATEREEVDKIGRYEGEVMVETARLLRENGFNVSTVSVGSTPTAKISGLVEGVTEIRPGNYVFYDAIQIGLGVAVEEDCSLSVLSTVISRPTPERVVIDAGSKVFALDQGAHGKSSVQGFGLVKGHSDVIIERLSEEHGILRVNPNSSLQIGDKIEIIPNHACTVINLFDEVNVIKREKVIKVWNIEGRGRVR